LIHDDLIIWVIWLCKNGVPRIMAQV